MNREDLGHWGCLQASPNVRKKTKYTQGLFISKIKCAARSGVRSIAGSALEHKPPCIRSFDVRSTTKSCTFDRVLCVRPHCVRSHGVRSITCNCLKIPTTQVLKRWRLEPVRATRGLRLTWLTLDHGSCVRSQCARSHQVCSSALLGAKIPSFTQFHPFEPQIAPRTYNTLKH